MGCCTSWPPHAGARSPAAPPPPVRAAARTSTPHRAASVPAAPGSPRLVRSGRLTRRRADRQPAPPRHCGMAPAASPMPRIAQPRDRIAQPRHNLALRHVPLEIHRIAPARSDTRAGASRAGPHPLRRTGAQRSRSLGRSNDAALLWRSLTAGQSTHSRAARSAQNTTAEIAMHQKIPFCMLRLRSSEHDGTSGWACAIRCEIRGACRRVSAAGSDLAAQQS